MTTEQWLALVLRILTIGLRLRCLRFQTARTPSSTNSIRFPIMINGGAYILWWVDDLIIAYRIIKDEALWFLPGSRLCRRLLVLYSRSSMERHSIESGPKDFVNQNVITYVGWTPAVFYTAWVNWQYSTAPTRSRWGMPKFKLRHAVRWKIPSIMKWGNEEQL